MLTLFVLLSPLTDNVQRILNINYAIFLEFSDFIIGPEGNLTDLNFIFFYIHMKDLLTSHILLHRKCFFLIYWTMFKLLLLKEKEAILNEDA